MKRTTLTHRYIMTSLGALVLGSLSMQAVAQRPSPPGTPTGNVRPGQVSLQWTPSEDDNLVRGYNVYLNGDYIKTVFDNRYVGELDTSQKNNFYVTAFDEPLHGEQRAYSTRSEEIVFDKISESDSSAEQLGQVDGEDTTRPSVPEGLTLVSALPDAITISWPASTDNVGVVGYNVYRQGNYTATIFGRLYTDENPLKDGANNYALVAFDKARNYSSKSRVLSIAVPDTTEIPVEPETPEPSNPDSSGEMVPVLDPSNRFPSPDPDDPFGSLLEVDTEEAVPGGPPTTPKNLRIDLVSNDWAEFSWAPANDDDAVVAYNIYRSDGVTYVVSPDQTDPNAGSQAEIDKYWSTTSFIDCNFTRFDTAVHNCRANQPVPGETYIYQVSAVDADGQESPQSKPLSITYHLPENAPVPIFDDFYKLPEDRFAQSNDLSETRFFLDEFDIVFNDEFDGTALDATKWQTELTWQDSIIINGEQQYFVRTQANPEFGYDPFSFDGDALTISAVPTPDELRDKLPPVCDVEDPTGNVRCQFLSGALSSHDRFGFLYGYVEGRMKAGGTPGMLSSFYLYHRYKGSGVKLHAPEIDILEYLGENPFGTEDAFQTYHFDDVNTGLTRSAPTMSYRNPAGERYSDDYHTYGLLWEPQLVVWYIDGKEVKRLTGPMVSRQPMNIVNYLVTGSAWAPTPDVSNPDNFPLEFNVDYIRVYQRDAYKGTASFGR